MNQTDRLIHGHAKEQWAALTVDQRQIVMGRRAPVGDCSLCDRARETGDDMMPSHTAKASCQSGHRNHCTCDTCY